MKFADTIKPILYLCVLTFGFTIPANINRSTIKMLLALTKLPHILAVVTSIWNFQVCIESNCGFLLVGTVVRQTIAIILLINNCFFNNKSLLVLLNTYDSLDEDIQKFSTKISRDCIRKRSLRIMKILMGIFLLFVVWEASLSFLAPPMLACTLVSSFEHTVWLITQILSVTLLEEVKVRFQIVNARILALLNSKKADSEQLLICARLHLSLCELSKAIVRNFQTRILLKVLFCFTHVVYTCFFLLSGNEKHPKFYNWVWYLLLLYFLAQNLFHTGIILMYPITISNEVGCFGKKISKSDFKLILLLI